MLVPSPPLLSTLLRSTAFAASVLLALAGPTQAQSAAQFLTIGKPGTPSVDQANAVIKHLPAGRLELMFNGENTTKTWQISLGRLEAARTQTFQLALLNAVSLLPERSAVKLSINGVTLATIPASSHEEVTAFPVKIPNGLLVPGLNTVQVSVALTHRVDCSVKATYELWASLDPAKTGFIVPKDAAFSVRSLGDLAAEPLADDGTTRIHMRLPQGAGEASIGQAGRFIGAIVRHAGLARPIVDSGPDLGRGPGFDVLINKGALQDDSIKALHLLARDETLTIGRDPATNRLVLVLSGNDDADIERQIDSLGRSGLGSVARSGGSVINSGSRRSFAELGFATENFAGRHYMSSLDITLPSDFYPANDRARLLLDGAHSGALDDNSALVFRVNGTLVSTMPLAGGKPERLQHAIVELPLRFFHPGHNEIAIEGMTSSPLDQQCDHSTMSHDPRLMIAGSSELEFPDFARLVTLPQIPSALSSRTVADGQHLNLYLPNADSGSVGAGLTLLANMAASRIDVGSPAVHVGSVASSDAPGIVIGTPDQLPETLASGLHDIAKPASNELPVVAETGEARRAEPNPMSTDMPLDAAATDNSVMVKSGVQAVVNGAEQLLRSRGFFFSGNQSRFDRLPATSTTMLIAAIAPDVGSASIGGLELPHFTRNPSQWLVVTAPTADLYQNGIAHLVANGQWSDLAGQAVSLNVKTDALQSIQPARVTYVMPERLVLSDIRPIFGGVLSNNIMLSIALLMLLMTILGVSTHILIRRTGSK
ncbi:cellulose biosynthesis cyclic di-GMP-binding regulatory protein BcsB [Lichenihabitans psoromatis]|uniref:cellulose biosynthesis cyclic di-GMP-binding regulatory protein BcsB n=1 Tax=Lichenihabitans psoromatis TaxID=2528642 RepID=UPI0010383C87|nr:cellulose biosynthesis cyclic di-GMP-binding regulatory protein BcsB [Lichenihabitans psoromatis]